jgi:proteasome alpha subunit
MSYNFYDFNNAVQQRNEYVDGRLRDGSPVVALSYDAGILLLTMRGTQRKVFEVYDRLALAALGRQSDVESIRLAAIDSAHREGFQRSEDDVSIQRLVGFGLSPAVKRAYNDPQTIPLTFRAIFAEINGSVEEDLLFVLGYDGEFKTPRGAAVAAGTSYAEEQALEILRPAVGRTLAEALDAALSAWGAAKSRLAPPPEKLDDDFETEETKVPTPGEAVNEARDEGLAVEAAVLERSETRQARFRLLTDDELSPAFVKLVG